MMHTQDISRMFPIYAEHPLLTTEQIEDIAGYMISPKNKVDDFVVKTNKNVKRPNPMGAGYTYFSQLISHDIVPGSSTLTIPRSTEVTPTLNLDSIYGDASLYLILFDSQGKFKLGQRHFDVLRDENGLALIPEPRNDENAIIVQFHLLWQSIHNQLIDKVSHKLSAPTKVDMYYIHNKAKQSTIALFHLLTIKDFLNKLLDTDVYAHFFLRSNFDAKLEPEPLNSIPVEFSHAAFRFGHSMILEQYDLNAKNSIKIKYLLRKSSDGPLTRALDIDWRYFFGSSKNEASRIDLDISSGMAEIPLNGNIAYLNLGAGITKKLPSIYAIADWLLLNDGEFCRAINLTDDYAAKLQSIIKNSVFNITIQSLSDDRKLPLWLGILTESGLDENFHIRLGKIGSTIVATTLKNSIARHYGASIATSENILKMIKDQLHNVLPPEILHKENLTMREIIDFFKLEPSRDY